MTDRICLHLMDEAPRIGTGMRFVDVISRGPKWVTVRYRSFAPKVKGDRKKRRSTKVVNHKFPRAVWTMITGEKI